MKLGKKIALSLALSFALLGGTTASAVTWTWQEAKNGGAEADYYSSEGLHRATVVRESDLSSDTDVQPAFQTAHAWIQTSWGEWAWFYFDN
jgi:hypothetical protein